jgi:hypothetical protein
MNRHRTNHQAIRLEVLLMLEVFHHWKHQVLMLVLSVLVDYKHHHMNHQPVVSMLQHLIKLLPTHPKAILPGLDTVPKYGVLVSMLIATHKLFDDKHQVVFKLIHKTFESAFFNHHLYHPQAHSSSKKCAHLNHHHHHLFVSDNKHHLFQYLLHSFFVKDHHNHQL